MRNGRKGQAIFEFIIASLILFSVIFYTINFLSMDFNMRHERFLTDHLESNSIRVSGMLMNPDTGIIDSWPALSQSKMNTLNTTCEMDYIGTLDDFGLREELPYVRYIHIKLTVTDLGSNTYLDCGRSPPGGVETAEVTRFAFLPSPPYPTDEIAIVALSLWGA